MDTETPEIDAGDDSDLDRRVMSALKASEERGDPPLLWAMEVARTVREKGPGLGFPNFELGRVLVANLCFENNTPTLWKLIDQVMACGLVCPIHVLALLTPRVIRHRIGQPEAFRLYLELLARYALSLGLPPGGSCRDKIAKCVDDALHLSPTYEVDQMDFGLAVVLFFLTVIKSLIDYTMEDCGLPLTSLVNHANLYNDDDVSQLMNLDARGCTIRHEHRDHLRRTNPSTAIEVMAKMTSDKRTKVFLRLAYLNLPEKFNYLLQRLQIIEAHISASQSLTSMRSVLDILFMNIRTTCSDRYQLHKHQLLGALVDSGPCSLNSSNISGAGKDACWISFDIFLENAMDAKHVYAISSADILAELIKTLQVINQATWQETFQALWVSALRFIQRDYEPVEGPIPHLDARLCLVLSIVPLAIISIIQEEHEVPFSLKPNIKKINSHPNKLTSRQHGLISCLQLLGQYSSLLSPPPSVVNAANHAATKATAFVSNLRATNGNPQIVGRSDSSIKAVGNMLHLIVEACIARNLIDTSAYFWPGYVVPSALPKDLNLVQDSPWSTFLGGAPMTASLKNSLMITPASSLVEVEKLYLIAVNGSDEEKTAAAKILCGASLVRGWNVQERVVRMVVKLLSPPMPPNSPVSEMGSHLIHHMPVLSAVLFGISCVDAIHILSLYGMVPEVAAALMPICEAFGSMPPPSNQLSNNSEEPSVSNIFSCAFLFLLKLWKFYRPPQEHCISGRGGYVRMELTLDYLLLMHNSLISSQNSSDMYKNVDTADPVQAPPKQPVYIHSFPKLRAWYFQNQACIASTLSGLSSKNPVHQVANKILNLICRKMTKTGTTVSMSSNSNSSTSGSPTNLTEDSFQWKMLPAWEILEAIPFVLEAVLTACAHGKLSSRDLTTGLRDLVDLFPASVATIISYFSAEITRGIWKPVAMDGTSWPSPASTLISVESEVKEILGSAGVNIQSCCPSGMSLKLPLPMAALVSLTITFKLDKNLEYIHGLVGQALETCATASSWPSMPIIAALWTQKVRRWHDFIVLSCSRTPFIRDKDAVTQLISSCFSSFLGPLGTRSSHLAGQRGVYGLLGQLKSDHGIRLPVKPGLLYLRSCRTFHDTHFLSKVIFKSVIEWSCKLFNECSSSGPPNLKSCRISLTAATSGVQQAAMLGASLLLIAGGAQLVQVLYEDTLPTMLLSAREENQTGGGTIASILEGYAMAYMLFFCGAFHWGLADTSPPFMSVGSPRRARLIGVHMDFMSGVLEGNISLACHPGTWKAYVLGYVGLLVRFVPTWIPEVKQETLRKLANGLRSWHEYDLALSLLECGGPTSMASVVEIML